MNYTTRNSAEEDTETQWSGSDEEKLESEKRKRGIHQNVNSIRIDNEETDFETRKQISMTEMDIFEKLLEREWNKTHTQSSFSKVEELTKRYWRKMQKEKATRRKMCEAYSHKDDKRWKRKQERKTNDITQQSANMNLKMYVTQHI